MTLNVLNPKEVMELLNSMRLSMVLSDLQRHESSCDEMKRRAAQTVGGASSVRPNDHAMESIMACLQETEKLCEGAKWDPAHTKVSLINTHIKYHRDECDWSSLSADLRNASDVVISTMWEAKLVQVPPIYASYVNSDSLFEESVRIAFPSAAGDIREAGNCIAVDCGTAAVFHLMRAVEWGIRALCVDLGVLTVPRKNANVPIEFSEWDKILDQLYPSIENKINALPPSPTKQEMQEFYFPLLFDIRGFKDAFRNHVMHARKTYSQKAADDVLDYVRRFFTLLSTKISE